MTDGPGPLPDTIWELLFLAVAVGLVASGFVYFTTLDAQLRFLVSDPVAYLGETPLSAGDTGQDVDALRFRDEDLSYLNRLASRSLGPAVADERAFCFDVEDGVVVDIWLLDEIEESDRHSVGGVCKTRFRSQDVDGTMHTHPQYVEQLSEEDRRIWSDIRYTCLMFAEAVVAPSGAVGGIRCWQVLSPGDPAEMEEIPVRVAG